MQRDATQTKVKKAAMLKALKKTLGVITEACELVGINRSTHHRWMNKDPEYKSEVEQMPEIAIDFAESSLFRQIKNEVTPATIFYLKTKGKKRGYVERNETINRNVDETLDISKLSDKELNEYINFCEKLFKGKKGKDKT